MKRVLPVVEKALWTAGCLLLLVYVVARADSAIGSRAALASAAAMRDATPQYQLPPTPQYRFWSQGRIEAYRASATQEAGPLVGTLQIPSLDLVAPLFADTDELHLNRGVGLIDGMAVPGESGNLGIAGHRDGFFRVLRDIRKGERMEVRTSSSRYVYEVSDVSIVDATDSTLLAPTREPSLTLVTCYPFYFVGPAPRRFVVRGVLTSP
jgi:sortase A